jgi:hypothetical protein
MEDRTMRKPRDYDAELKALDDKARQLKSRRIVQLGELVIACGGDALPIEQLAGVMLAAVEAKDGAVREAWRTKGAAFFRSKARTTAQRAAGDIDRASPRDGSGPAA